MIIFDIETTGLYPESDQICQLSYIKIDENYNVKFAKNFYFTVNGMDRGAERVHGLSIDKLKELSNGKIFKDYANEIYQDFLKNEMLIAHNISFDFGFLYKELDRAGFNTEFLNNQKQFCTMHAYIDIVKTGWSDYHCSYKWPRLEEVLDYLGISDEIIDTKTKEVFKIDDSNESTVAHDARFDVVATMEAYRFLGNYDRLDEFRNISMHIEEIEYSLRELKKFFNLKENDNTRNLGVYDLDYIDDFYNKFADGAFELSRTVQYGIDNLKKIGTIEKDEYRRSEMLKREELKALLEEKTQNAKIIKAVEYCSYDWNIERAVLILNAQLEEEYQEERNVRLIELAENKYLLLCDNRKHIVEISNIYNNSSKKINPYKRTEYEIISTFYAPDFDNSENIDESNVREYDLIKNTSYIESPKHKRTEIKSWDDEDDDEIPF